MKRTRSPKWRRWLRCKRLTKLGSVLLGVALGAALVTWAERASAYRTAASDPKFAGTERVRWATDEIRFRLHTDLPPELDLCALELAVVDSLAKWSRPTCSRLEFVYEANTSTAAAAGDGVNTIQWVRDGWVARGFDPTAAAVTDVQYQKDPGGAWTIVEADLYLNGEFNRWVIRGAQGADRSVQSVLLHEAGHMLGLLHPCEVGAAGGAPDCAADPAYATSAVYPIYSFSHNPVLAADDEAGVCFLYPGIRCEVTGCSSGLVCHAEGCVAPCGDATCAPGQTCAGGQCTTGSASIASIAPPPATSCSPEVPCPAGQRCEGSRCQGVSPAGDPCSASTSCSSGICEAGYCAATCELDSDCGLGEPLYLAGRARVGRRRPAAAHVRGHAADGGVVRVCERVLGRRMPRRGRGPRGLLAALRRRPGCMPKRLGVRPGRGKAGLPAAGWAAPALRDHRLRRCEKRIAAPPARGGPHSVRRLRGA